MNAPSNLAGLLAKGKTRRRPKPAPAPQPAPAPLPQPGIKKPAVPLPGYDTRVGLDKPTIWTGKPKKSGLALTLGRGR